MASGKFFALIYDTATKEPSRLVDCSDEPDGGVAHMEWVKTTLPANSTMEVFDCSNVAKDQGLGFRRPAVAAELIGTGIIAAETKESPGPNAPRKLTDADVQRLISKTSTSIK